MRDQELRQKPTPCVDGWQETYKNWGAAQTCDEQRQNERRRDYSFDETEEGPVCDSKRRITLNMSLCERGQGGCRGRITQTCDATPLQY